MTKKEFLRIHLNNKNYINHKTCSQCSKCCNSSGCALLPLDIEPFSTENVIRYIDTGKYSIMARIFSKKNIHICLQSREINGDIFQINKPHKKCALLTEKGCLFSDEERPTYALNLIPGYYGYGSCCQSLDDEIFYNMWNSVQNIMEEVVQHYSRKSSYQVVNESFDEVAKEIYQTLINKENFENYNTIFKNSIKFEVDLYEKIIKISDSAGTTEKVITRLVTLEHNDRSKDYYGSVLASNLLPNKAYRLLKKPAYYASIEEKIETYLKYNELYFKQ